MEKPLVIQDGSRCRGRHGFTQTELLAAIAIILVLAAIIIPVVGMVREGATVVQCQSNLRQIYTALMIFTVENDDYLPPGPNWPKGLTYTQYGGYSASNYSQMASHLAPYMGKEVLTGDRIDTTWFCPGQSKGPSTFFEFANCRCYAIPYFGSYSNYPFGNIHQGGMKSSRMNDYLGDRLPSVAWVLRDIDRSVSRYDVPDVTPSRSHRNGHNFLYFDGSVRLLTDQEQAERLVEIESGRRP